MSRTLSLAVLGLIWTAVGTTSVQAQDESLFMRDRNTAVMERERPEYTSDGIQKGAFIFNPALTVGLEFNDNIYGASSSEESDIIGIFNPAIDVSTTWSQHSLSGNLTATRREYADFNDESVWHLQGSALGRLDIVRGTFVEANVSYADLTEPRTSAGAANTAAEPIAYTTDQIGLKGEREMGRTKFQLGVTRSGFDYEDGILVGGGVADQDFRDRSEVVYTIRGDYAVSPATSLFARGRFNTREYDLTPPAAPLLRDSEGYIADVGADFDIGGVARGSVAVGHIEQDYEDASLPDIDGFSTDVVVDWFPTQLTTVTGTASRGVFDAAVAGSGGFLGTAFGINVDHELRRNVVVSAGVTWGTDEYFGIDRQDDRWSATVSTTWYMNRNAGVRASVAHFEQESSGTDGNQDFSSNVVAVSLVLRP
jgi:hypothetical protein